MDTLPMSNPSHECVNDFCENEGILNCPKHKIWICDGCYLITDYCCGMLWSADPNKVSQILDFSEIVVLQAYNGYLCDRDKNLSVGDTETEGEDERVIKIFQRALSEIHKFKGFLKKAVSKKNFYNIRGTEWRSKCSQDNIICRLEGQRLIDKSRISELFLSLFPKSNLKKTKIGNEEDKKEDKNSDDKLSNDSFQGLPKNIDELDEKVKELKNSIMNVNYKIEDSYRIEIFERDVSNKEKFITSDLIEDRISYFDPQEDLFTDEYENTSYFDCKEYKILNVLRSFASAGWKLPFHDTYHFFNLSYKEKFKDLLTRAFPNKPGGLDFDGCDSPSQNERRRNIGPFMKCLSKAFPYDIGKIAFSSFIISPKNLRRIISIFRDCDTLSFINCQIKTSNSMNFGSINSFQNLSSAVKPKIEGLEFLKCSFMDNDDPTNFNNPSNVSPLLKAIKDCPLFNDESVLEIEAVGISDDELQILFVEYDLVQLIRNGREYRW